MRLTGEGLARFALGQIGMPYFYGAKITHGILTDTFVREMNRRFPDLVSEAYIKKAYENHQVGAVNVDCSGLIGAYRGKERSTAQLYAGARARLLMGEAQHFAAGTVLWKQGHVGVYAGRWCFVKKQLGKAALEKTGRRYKVGDELQISENDMMCVEAKGIDYGVILSKVEDTDWKAGLTFPDLSYTYQKKLTGSRKGENPYREPMFLVMCPQTAKKMYCGQKTVTSGEGVRWLQWELVQAGYLLAVDGRFGEETKAALTAFQTSCELRPDGVAGPRVRAFLTADDG